MVSRSVFSVRAIVVHVLRNAVNYDLTDGQSRRLSDCRKTVEVSVGVKLRALVEIQWVFRAVKRRKLTLVLIQTPRVTWLILPVVICLSQRLSHACLSTSLIKVKPRMAH